MSRAGLVSTSSVCWLAGDWLACGRVSLGAWLSTTSWVRIEKLPVKIGAGEWGRVGLFMGQSARNRPKLGGDARLNWRPRWLIWRASVCGAHLASPAGYLHFSGRRHISALEGRHWSILGRVAAKLRPNVERLPLEWLAGECGQWKGAH